MNFALYFHGNPDSNYRLYPSDGNEKLLSRHIESSQEEGSHLVIERVEDLIYYSFVYHGLVSADGNRKASLAITLCLNSIYCIALDKLFALIDKEFKELFLFQSKIITNVEDDHIGYISADFDQYASDIKFFEHKLRKATDQFTENQDYVYLDRSFTVRSITREPKVLAFSIGNLNIQDYFRAQPYLLLQTSDIATSLSVSSALLRKRRNRRRLITFLSLIVGIISGFFIAYNFFSSTSQQVVENQMVNLINSPSSWGGNVLPPRNAPRWVILEPLDSTLKDCHYNVYIIRFVNENEWQCDKYIKNHCFAKGQERKSEHVSHSRAILSGCANIYANIRPEHIKVVLKSPQIAKLEHSYKSVLESAYGRIIVVPNDWKDGAKKIPWQIAYPIMNKDIGLSF